jgi:regulator of cell morphogenesis and NO signaling
MKLEETSSVAEIIRHAPATSRVFERLGIDYCCRGKEPLQTACARVRVPVDQALELLNAALREQERDVPPIPNGVDELLARILDVHHTFTRAELERLSPLCDKVVRVHGDAHPELARVGELFHALRDHMGPHMLKEERMLFPAIRELAAGRRGPFPFGRVSNPLSVMEADHLEVGAWLEELTRLTDDYSPPSGACGSYRALYGGLADLQRDLHEHVYLENHVLFPLARELELKLGEH